MHESSLLLVSTVQSVDALAANVALNCSGDASSSHVANTELRTFCLASCQRRAQRSVASSCVSRSVTENAPAMMRHVSPQHVAGEVPG